MTEETQNIAEETNLEETILAEDMVEIDVPVDYSDEDTTDIEDDDTTDVKPVAEPEPAPVKSDLDTMRELLTAQNEQHANDMKALIEALKPKEEVAPVLTDVQHYEQMFQPEVAQSLANAGLVRKSDVDLMRQEIASLKQEARITSNQRQIIEIERPALEALQNSGYSTQEVQEIIAQKNELLQVGQYKDAETAFELAEALWSKRRDKKTASKTAAARVQKTQLQEQAGIPSSNGGVGRVSISKAELEKLGKMMDDPAQEDEAVRRYAALRKQT